MENLSALVERVQRCNKDAESELFAWLRPYVFGLVRRRHGLRSATWDADASDLTQAAVLRIMTSIAGYRGETDGQFRVWVATIVRHLAVDGTRRRSASEPAAFGGDGFRIDEQIADNHSTPSERLMRLEQAERLQQALETLPIDQQNAIRWRYMERCSFEEVGRRLGGRTADAATQLVRRGICRLNELLAARLVSAGNSSTSTPHGPNAPLSSGAG